MILFDHFLFQQHVNRNIFNVVVWKVDEEFALIEFDEVELTGGYVAGELIVTQIQELQPQPVVMPGIFKPCQPIGTSQGFDKKKFKKMN